MNQSEVEDRPAARVPAPAAPLGGEQLVQPARPALHDEHVPVRAALDLRPARERVRAAVGLAGVVERDAHLAAARARRR